MAYRTTPATREAKRSRREALLRSAHEAVAETGFAAASVKAIAAGASVSAGTVYTYFGSREELLAEVFQRAAAAEFAAVRDAVARAAADGATDGSLTRELTALVHTFARRALAGRTLAWALLIEPAGELIDAHRLRFRRQYADLTEAIITRAIDSGQAPDQDVRVVGPALIGLISEALTGPLSLEGETPNLLTTVTHMCLRAIGGSP